MSEDYVGNCISVEVRGGLGFYQGEVKSVNGDRQTLTLTRVIHNGKPLSVQEITINAMDILDLEILSKGPKTNCSSAYDNTPLAQSQDIQRKQNFQSQNQERSEAEQNQLQQHHHQHYQSSYQQQQQPLYQLSCQQTSYHNHQHQQPLHGYGKDEEHEGRRKPRASVGETLAHGPYMVDSSGSSHSSGFQDYHSPYRNYRYGSDMNRTPSKKDRYRRWQDRDETTFGTPIDEDFINTEFDFEKNLALFDKQAVFEEIQSLKPDVVRQADKRSERKYRCDENVLPAKPKPLSQITLPPSGAGEVLYTTDSGLLVPSLKSALRSALFSMAYQHGLTSSRQLEMIGRGATDIILTLIGGCHRLKPGNSHQCAVVVVLAGLHLQGASGINTARQLESHGVRTVIVTPNQSSQPPLVVSHELQLYSLTCGTTTTDPNSLPSTVDLIVDARDDHNMESPMRKHSWYTHTSAWASTCRAPVVALDPPSDIPSLSPAPLPARLVLCPSLPLAYTPTRGKVYLVNLPIPSQTFRAVNIKYTPPFGAKLVIPLHPCE